MRLSSMEQAHAWEVVGDGGEVVGRWWGGGGGRWWEIVGGVVGDGGIYWEIECVCVLGSGGGSMRTPGERS